jgi:hypothetical protein
MHMLDRKGHGRSPLSFAAIAAEHDIAVGSGQRASLLDAVR